MRSPKIPPGWQYWSSETDREDAWRAAMEYKQAREKVCGSLFVRVRVVPAAHVHWILIREEERPA